MRPSARASRRSTTCTSRCACSRKRARPSQPAASTPCAASSLASSRRPRSEGRRRRRRAQRPAREPSLVRPGSSSRAAGPIPFPLAPTTTGGVWVAPGSRSATSAGLHAAASALAGGAALAVCASGAGWLAGLAVLALAAGGAGLAARGAAQARTARSAELAGALDALARGAAPPRLDAAGPAELAQLSAAARRACAVVHAAAERDVARGARLAAVADQLGEALAVTQRCAALQEAGVEETASLQAHINASIRSIHGEVGQLAHANESCASSVLELATAVDQVARSAANLQQTVESSTTSIHQMGQSIRLAAENGDSVQQMAEETAASMTEMDRALQEVGLHVRGASDLTRRVSESADEGTRAVGATVEGMEAIRRVTNEARSVLEGLVRRIGEIGEIATVIGGITDETNLLSLNAAIIAAQAGRSEEHTSELQSL